MKLRLDKHALFERLGYEPHPGQLAVHESEAPRRILACGVRWGKSTCAAMEGIAAALAPAESSLGWVVAPTYGLAERVFRQIVDVLREHLRHRVESFSFRDHKIIVRNLGGGVSEVRGKTADNPNSLLGAGLDWLIVDEAARLKPNVWEAHLSQRLVDRRGWGLLISTPRGVGFFHELFRRGQTEDPHFASWNFPSWTNPHLNREAVDAERDRVSGDVFDQEFGGAFLDGMHNLCPKCGGPRPFPSGPLILQHDDQAAPCEQCGLMLAPDGTVLGWTDGSDVVRLKWFHLHPGQLAGIPGD